MDSLPMISTRPVNMVRCEEREDAGRYRKMCRKMGRVE